MIDFRYHLVSIVSIFLALAVGIVLGAGPLKEDLGDTLTSEVTKLRDDRTALRAELDEATSGIEARDDFTQAGNARLLADRLENRVVSVVVLPGAEDGTVKNLASTLRGAGATIGATVTLQDAWVDPSKQAVRSTLAEQLAPGLSLPVEGNGALLDTVLAAAVLRQDEGPNPGAANALEGLRTGDLVSVAPEDATPGTAAVVVGGPITSGDADERKAMADQLAQLAGPLDAASSGAVLVSSGTQDQEQPFESVVTAVREDTGLVRGLSTVDDGNIPMGRASTVLALVEQYAGRAGQYGLDPDARAAFPALPAS